GGGGVSVDEHDAAVEVLAASAPPGAGDHERPHRATTPDEDLLAGAGAIEVLRRGLAVTPELRTGIALTAALAGVSALGRLAVPVLIQQILDRGVLGPSGYRPGFVIAACSVVAVLIGILYLISRATFLRLVAAAEATLKG